MSIQLNLPGYSTEDLERAVAVIGKCRKEPLPEFHFPCPFIAPGGQYGNMWWQLDYALALAGTLWFDPDFAFAGIRNFSAAQKEDGRIPLWGNDRLPDALGKNLQKTSNSSLPKLFDAVGKIASRMDSPQQIGEAYRLVKRYLDWWITARYDASSGLFSAVFEETFIPYYGYAGEYAPVDLNMELVHGFHVAADLAHRLERTAEETLLRERGRELARNVDQRLWNEEEQFFLPLLLKTKKHLPLRMASAFSALRDRTASPEHTEILLKALTDPERFNWGRRALTSVDQRDPAFTLVTGPYQGNPSWSGSVWTLTNENAIRGLCDCGEKELAAELLVHTLDLFKTQYCEFLNPATGEPCGVMDYAWTAGACIDLIFSVLFGIQYDAGSGNVTLSPVLPAAWEGKTLTVCGLPLPGKERSVLNLNVKCGLVPAVSMERIPAS